MARLGALALVSVLVCACGSPPERNAEDVGAVGSELSGESTPEKPSGDIRRPAPSLVLPTVDGSGSVALAEQRGKVVLVDLWATWCVPCIAELPHLQELSEEYSSDDFMLVGIVLESGETEEIRDFLKERELSYPQVLGTDDDRDAFGPFLGYPTKYLIDREGAIVKRYFGIVGERLKDDVEELVRTGMLPESTK